MQVDTNIKLNSDEQELFNIIKDVVSKFTPSTQVFAVGGWTRDKLLGINSNDIDIMVSNMSGEDFAKLVTRYMGVKDANVIRENPEASKHITTAKAYIPLSSGKVQEVDFAQARDEVYTEDSRIPQLKTATPQEDAYRRDLTINSVFYDILNKNVVDFTGKGIKDLISMTIRTPEDPHKTYMDDPLRIFRTIRFAAKYGGEIDPETYKAMQDPALRDMIKQKVSKERISEEIEKMLSYPNADRAIKLIKETGILEDIIKESIVGTEYEGKIQPFEMEQSNPHHELSVWGHTLETITHTLNNFANDDPEKRAIATLAALFHDIGKLYSDIQKPRFEKDEKPRTYIDPVTKQEKQVISYPMHEKTSAVIAPLVMKYLKFSNKKIKEVENLVAGHMKMHEYTRDNKKSDEDFRKLIRELTELGIEYTDMFKLTLADAYSKSKGKIDPEVIETYNNLNQRLKEINSTMGAKEDILTPVLSGNEIMGIFKDKQGNPKKPGVWMKDVVNFTKTLKDRNPQMTKEEATDLLKRRFPELLPKPILNGDDILNIFNQPAGSWIKQVKDFIATIPDGVSKEEAVNMVMKQFPQYLSSVKTASSNDSNDVPNILCPMPLLEQKKKELKELFSNKNYYQVYAVIKDFMQKFGNDEEVINLIARYLFLLIREDAALKDREVIQHVFNKAEKEIYNCTLGCFVFGLLLILNTKTEDEVIREIGERVSELCPELFKTVLDLIPSNAERIKIKKEFESKVKNK